MTATNNERREKYLDVEYWMARNRLRVERVGLHRSPPMRVLDLGCGCGYFLRACQDLGHEAIGIDRFEEDSIYTRMRDKLGVRCVWHTIQPMEPLPDVGRIDVLTAHMVCFNGHCSDRLWGAREWEYLLDSVGAPVVSLDLNAEPDGTLYPPGLREFFESRGARIDAHRVLIDRSR